MTLKQFVMRAERHRESVKRADRRAGGVIAMLYNLNRDPEKDRDGIDWQDVFTEWKEKLPEQTEDELYEAMLLWAKSTEGLGK
jgi:hypothetical protein